MQFKIKTQPTDEPVTLGEAKAQIRVDHSDEDDLIQRMIGAARGWVEKHLDQPLMEQTITGATDVFPGTLELTPNLRSVVEVRYVDGGDVEQTVDPSSYLVDDFSRVGAVYPSPGKSWPDSRGAPFDVQVDFVAGYETPADVPDEIKSAVLLLVGHWYANREQTVTGSVPEEIKMGVESLLWYDKRLSV